MTSLTQDLFGPITEPPLPEGAVLLKNFITQDQETWLMDRIDAKIWNTGFARRRQFYGTRYGNAQEHADSMPSFLVSLGNHLAVQGIFTEPPNQVLINEYLPGQGIADHVDRTDLSGETVVSLSLLSDVVMDFKPLSSHLGPPRSLILPRFSLLILQRTARHQWTHGIAKRLTDTIHGHPLSRHRRVSITYRDPPV